MKCEQNFDRIIEAYIDNEATPAESKQLHEHLNHCESCKQRVQELNKVIAFVQSSSHIAAPDDFTASVMKKLPQKKQMSKWKQWTRKHPLLIAAAVFFLLMATSLSMWNDEEQLVVKGSTKLSINQENGVVIVPKGEVIEGDLTIHNGKLQVEGEIKGNVLLVNSDKYYASTGHVTGEIHEVNQMLEWVWYHIKSFLKDVVALSSGKETTE